MNEPIMYHGIELLPITSDVVFKAVFGTEENKDMLAALLNNYLDITIESPNDLQFVSTEKIKRFQQDKTIRLDLRVATTQNEHIDIEIQILNTHEMEPRSIYYACTLLTELLKDGQSYNELGKAVALNFLCYNMNEFKTFKHHYRFKHTGKINHELENHIEIVYVELLKVKSNTGDIWSSFLSAENEQEIDLLVQKSPDIRKAVDRMKIVSADEKARYQYFIEKKARRDAASRIRTEELRLEAAIKNGLEQGIEQGIEQGLEQGLEQGIGIGEKESTHKIAQKMLAMGLTTEVITEATGLTDEEIKQLES